MCKNALFRNEWNNIIYLGSKEIEFELKDKHYR